MTKKTRAQIRPTFLIDLRKSIPSKKTADACPKIELSQVSKTSIYATRTLRNNFGKGYSLV